MIHRLPNFLTRTVMAGVWCAVIAAGLFAPRIVSWLSAKKSITIFAWTGVIDREVLRAFEKETGITVYMSYYESNEELFAKLKVTGGSGIDLIMPTDYTIQQLIEQKLLKRIDVKKISGFSDIHPKLLGQYFDPHNQYSVPMHWAIYGLGLDKRYFGGLPSDHSWSLVFDAPLKYQVVMPNDAREAIFVAAQYLFGSIQGLDDEKLQHIQQLLIQQKPFVEAYTDNRADYLLFSGAAPIAVISSADVMRAMKEHDCLAFVLPKEGGFLSIDSLAMPASSAKDDLVYQLINYLYRPEVLRHHVAIYPFFPPTVSALTQLAKRSGPTAQLVRMLDEQPDISFFKNVIPNDQMHQVLLEVKSV